MKKSKNRLLALLLCAMLILPACAATGQLQPGAPVPLASAPAPTQTQAPLPDWGFMGAEETILALTSPEMGGRAAGSAGNAAAADYLAGALEALGLSPYFDGSWFLEYGETVLEPEKAAVEIAFIAADGTEAVLEEGVDFSYTLPYRDFDAELTVSREGGEGTALLAEDYGAARAYIKGRPERVSFMEDIGNKHSSVGNEHSEASGMAIRLITGRAYAKAREAASVRIRAKQAAWIGGTATDVAGYIPGTEGNEAFVVFGHSDGSGSCGETLYPSAYDNASGTAAVLRAAHRFMETGADKAFDVIILFTNGEESGMRGIDAFEAYLADRYACVNYINIDCFGRAGRDYIDIFTDDTTPSTNPLAETLAEAGAALGARVRNEGYSGDNRRVGANESRLVVTLSDVEDDADASMHSPADTIDLLDPARIEAAAEMVAGFLAAHEGPLFVYSPNEAAEAAAAGAEADAREAALAKYGVGPDEFVYVPGTRNFDRLYFGRFVDTAEALESTYPGFVVPREVGGYAFAGMEAQSSWMKSGVSTVAVETAGDGTAMVRIDGEYVPLQMLAPETAMPVSALLETGGLRCNFYLNYEAADGREVRVFIGVSSSQEGLEPAAENDAAVLLSDDAFAGIQIFGADGMYYDFAWLEPPGGVMASLAFDTCTEDELRTLLHDLDLRGMLETVMQGG